LYRLKRITGRRDIKFEPRRRQDIDFIFMAARPRQARLIVPQIRFHHGGGVPIYATSHAWNGVRDPSADRDMNGIIICDSPWTLSAAKKPDSLYQLLTRYWPKALQSHLRLYALGIDAYNIVPYLGWLRKEPYERFSGESGSLYVDQQGRVLRRLQWAMFRRGIAQLIKQPVSVKNTPGKTGTGSSGTGPGKTP
jgi:outer membrane PBP1 activator LpoA protein